MASFIYSPRLATGFPMHDSLMAWCICEGKKKGKKLT
jgi:hypothetical protein